MLVIFVPTVAICNAGTVICIFKINTVSVKCRRMKSDCVPKMYTVYEQNAYTTSSTHPNDYQ